MLFEGNTVEDYVLLAGEFATQINDLSAIWLDNLEQSHHLTVNLWGLSEQRTETINELEIYIEDNLADPQGQYVLDSIQLQEAIARQEAQVNYADALGESVDSLEEAIAVLNIQQQQANFLLEKIEHISTLTRLEEDYALLIQLEDDFTQFFSKFDALNQLYSDLESIDNQINQKKSKFQQYNAIFRDDTSTYYFYTLGNTSWYGAKTEAESVGGNLVIINDASEWEWVDQKFGGINYYIGATDAVNEGDWRWVDGTKLAINSPFWAPGEPNNSKDEDYAQATPNGWWNDEDNNKNIPGLIEVDFESLYNQRISQVNVLRSATISAFNELKELRDLLNNNQLSSLVAEIDLNFVNNYLQEYDDIFAEAEGNLDEETLKHLQNEVFRPFYHTYNDLATGLFIEELVSDLHLPLINSLEQELTNKTDNLIDDIDLVNDQQELWLENNLQNYIEQKKNSILNSLSASINGIDNQIYELETFKLPISGSKDFTKNKGWATQLNYPRLLGDVNGDGKDDIVGFAPDGVSVSIAIGDGTFQSPIFAFNQFSTSKGWTNQNDFPRLLGDVNGDGKDDIVGFAPDGVSVSIAIGDGIFQSPIFAFNQFSGSKGWMNQNDFPRLLGDVNGDGKDDIVGFALDGVSVALAIGDGTFQSPIFAFNQFSISKGWMNQNDFPRLLGDVNGDGKDDIVGFAPDGVSVALAIGDGTFQSPIFAFNQFSTSKGWTNQNDFPRLLGDVNSDGMDDIIGFAGDGVSVSIAIGDGNFDLPVYAFDEFSKNHDWISQDSFPRHIGDVNGDGYADITAFGTGDILVSLNNVAHQRQEDVISNLQSLEIESVYLTLQTEENPNKLQSYLEEQNQTLQNKQNNIHTILRDQVGSLSINGSENYFIGDLDGDKKDEILVQKGSSTAVLAYDTSTQLFGSKTIAGSVIGSWRMDGTDRFYLGNFRGDGTQEILVQKRDWMGVLSYDISNESLINKNTTADWVGDWAIKGTEEIHIADLNGDGKDEIFVQKGSSVGILTYNSSTKYLTSEMVVQDKFVENGVGDWSIYGTENYYIADLDGDGKDEIIVHQGSLTRVLTYDESTKSLIGKTIVGPWIDNSWQMDGTDRFYIGDFNGDDTDEILVQKREWMGILSYNSSTQSLTSKAIIKDQVGDWSIYGTEQIHIADLDGDGKEEILVQKGSSIGVLSFDISTQSLTSKMLLENSIGGWQMDGTDRLYIGNFNFDETNDVLAQKNNWLGIVGSIYNPSTDEIRHEYYPTLSDLTTVHNLKQQITDELVNSQQELETLEEQINQKQANATAALSQANWYEEQAAINWNESHKAGPTWTEYRQAKGKSGKSTTVAIKHVDHHWIIWDTYTKQANNLRQYVANLDQEIIEDTQQQNLTDELIAQWQEANSVADEAELTLDQFITQLERLEVQRQLLPAQEAQLETFSELLPILKEQLEIAVEQAEEAKGNTITEQAEYDTSSEAYQTALNDVLEQKATLDSNTQNLLQQIANTRAWVEQQTLYLETETQGTIVLQQQLQTELDNLNSRQVSPENETKIAQLQQSVDLLNQKQIILTAQQTALTQKITLLNAQKTVVETEHQLLLSTIASPDSDYSNLEEQLLDAQNALAEVQELAQQAEATSIALTASMEDLQAFLEVQNDQYLAEIQSKQQNLQQLLEATELKENYTLEATEKQLELNTLEIELQARLIEAREAGSQEAAYWLEEASANNFATAAEIYYHDYLDLMTDTGGGCAGGIARPDDAIKADYYYNELIKYRALQEQAQKQADQFTKVKQEAEKQIDLIENQQTIAQNEFNEIQSNINNTQEDIESLQQQLNIAELRIDALQYLRNWTEQTFLQLLQVEELNLAQATLEQEFAEQRQLGIDETITAQFERQQADIERDRAIATAKIEQLNQLQAEDALQQALNDLRTDLGLQPIDDIIQQADYKGQLAGILTELENIENSTRIT